MQSERQDHQFDDLPDEAAPKLGSAQPEGDLLDDLGGSVGAGMPTELLAAEGLPVEVLPIEGIPPETRP